LKLTVLRSLSDDALAQQLGLVTARSSALRNRALERLSNDLGLPVDETRSALVQLSEDDWRSTGSPLRPRAKSALSPIAAAESRQSSPPGLVKQRAGNHRLLYEIAATIAVVVIVGVVLWRSFEPSLKREAPPGAVAVRAPAAPFGTVEIAEGASGRRLRLIIRNLPDGRYHAWLYNTIIDARPLGPIRPDKRFDVPLPTAFGHYRFVDISLQPPGRRKNHSGQSVLRAETTDLPVGGTRSFRLLSLSR
jgi:hypothetical protein